MIKKRERDLLNLLLEQSDFKPATYFQDRLHVSTKTIYSDLKNLDPIFEKYRLVLQKTPRKGIYLNDTLNNRDQARISANLSSEFTIEFQPHQRQLLIFSDFLFSSKKKGYKNYAKDYYVCYQSIKKDVDEIVFFLKKQGLESEMTAQGFQIEAKEQDIQRSFKAYVEFYENKYNEKWNFSEVIDVRLQVFPKKFINDIESKRNYTLSSHSSKSFMLSLLIFLARISVGKHITSSSDFLFKEIQKYQLYFMAIEFAEMVNRETGIIFQTSDLYYLCSLFLAHGVEPAIEEADISDYFKKSASQLIKIMERLTEVDFSKDDYLFRAILFHIIPMVHRLKNGISISNPLKDHIKQQYSTMFTLIQFATSSFEKSLDIQMTEDEISFLTIHFQVAFEKVQSTKHILIVCSKGLATSQLIFNRIQQTLPESVVLEIVSEDQITSTSLEDVDMIISTVPLEIHTIPVIYVSPLPSKQEMAQITSLLTDINEEEKTFSVFKNKDLSLIEKHLQNEFLFPNQKAKNKTEILDQMIKQYEKFDCVFPNFEKSIYDRESQWGTELFTGAAMPHADPSTVKKTTVSFYTLKEPVIWDTFPVQFVIMLAIAEEDIEEARLLITLFNDLLYSAQAIQYIAQSETNGELRNRIVESIKNEGTFP